MQLRNASNEVIAQFSSITDNNGVVLLSEEGGELVFHKSTTFLNPFSEDGKKIIIAGSGMNFRGATGNTTTLYNDTLENDTDLHLPLITGTIALDPTP
jgi:hypothetical protein